MQNLRSKKETCSLFSGIHVLVTRGGTGLIPEWVSDKSMGCEVTIELPKKWYKDNFLGFALFFHFVDFLPVYCEFSISQGDQFISMSVDFVFPISSFALSTSSFDFIMNFGKVLKELVVVFFPQIVIPNEYRSRRWKYLKVCIKRHSEVKSVGVHPLYAKAQDDNKKRSRNDKPAAEEESQSELHHKRSRQHVF